MLGIPSNARYIDALRGAGPYALNESAPRPNIFVITVDMIPPEAYTNDGYRNILHTPNMDRIQDESVTFTNAFSISPLCGPSRAATMTGRYPYLTVNAERAHDGHEYELRPGDIIFPEYLLSSGYVTRHVGKCHVGASKFIDAFGENAHPWDRWAPPLHDDDEYHQHLDALGIGAWRFKRSIEGRRPDRITAGDHYGGWVEQIDGQPFPLEATYPYYLGLRAARTVRTLCTRTGRGRPIYMQLDFFAPHQPFFIPDGMKQREAALREAISIPKSCCELLRNGFKPDPNEPSVYQTYRLSTGLYTEEAVRDYIVANLLQVEVLDHAIGVFLDALESESVYRDALVIFAADHGEMNGERCLIDKGVYGHPKVVRVPLIVRCPKAKFARQQVETPVSLLDLCSTILRQAGISPHARLDGIDLMSLIQGETPHRPRSILFEAGWHEAPNPAVAVQRYVDGRHYLYTYNLTDRRDELYDLSDLTYTNLAGSREFGAVREAMVRRLAQTLRGDRRWRCYWHTMRLQHSDLLGVEAGDQQMFEPE